MAPVTIVDCGFCLEADEEITFDTVAPRRNGATLAILADADLVLAVGSADPSGMERLVRGLAELGEMVPEANPSVVLNRSRRSAASPAGVRGCTRPVHRPRGDRIAARGQGGHGQIAGSWRCRWPKPHRDPRFARPSGAWARSVVPR